MAVLAHVLQVVGWWIAPLIIFLTKRESRFVSFHALQALLLQIAYMALSAAFMGLWFVGMFVMMAHAPAAKNAPPPLGLFVLMATVWLGWIGMWVMTLVGVEKVHDRNVLLAAIIAAIEFPLTSAKWQLP